MASFLLTERKADKARRYYIDGHRVNRAEYERQSNLAARKDCFHTAQTATHWRHRFEGEI